MLKNQEVHKKLKKLKHNIEATKNQSKKLEKLKTKKENLVKAVKIEEKKNQRRDEALENIKDFHNALEKFRQEYVYKQLNKVSDDIMHYYNKFVEKNLISSLNLVKKNNSIKYKANLERMDNIDPLSVLSEGQLRCFGLAILFAVNNKINSDFIILDDIVNAIDIEHRYNIIDFLVDDIVRNNRQYIITTHDKLFREKLVNLIPDKRKLKAYRITSNNPVLENDYNNINFEEKIKKCIEENDCRTAVIYMRILLENNIYEIAENNNIKVAFKDKLYKYNLKSFFGEIKSEYDILDKVYNELTNSSLKWGILNQEHHYWSETSMSLDCSILKDIFEQVKIIKRTKEFLELNEEDRKELVSQVDKQEPNINKFSNVDKLADYNFINKDEEWGEKYYEIKEWL